MTIFDDLKAFLEKHEQDAIDVAVTAATTPLKDQIGDLQLQNANLASVNTSLQAQLATTQQALADCQAAQPNNTPDVVPPFLIGGLLRTDASLSYPRPVWDIVRTYNIGDALKVFSLGKGRRVATSFGSMLGGPGWRNNATTVNTLQSQLKQLPDQPDNWVADTHEFDNPAKYGTNVTEYLADAAKFKQVVDGVNQTRQNPLQIFRCCMAYSYSQPDRNIDAFFTQDMENYDAFGPDVYSYNQIDVAFNKATEYNKLLVIPEMGPLNAVPQVDTATSGGSILDYMQTAYPKWDSSPLRRWACWFDKAGAGADLDKYTKSRAYWSGLVVG